MPYKKRYYKRRRYPTTKKQTTKRTYNKQQYKRRYRIPTMSLLKPEKKHLVVSQLAQPIGQLNYNSQNVWYYDITPNPSESDTYQGKAGSGINLISSYFQMQFFDQSTNCNQPMKIKMMLFQVLGTPQSPANFVNGVFNDNNFVGGGATIIDYNSSLDPDLYGTYRILRTVYITHRADNYSTQTIATNKQFGHKYGSYGHAVRYLKDTAYSSNGQLILVVLADTGNVHNSSASTLTNTAVKTTNSGVFMNLSIDHYYFDV